MSVVFGTLRAMTRDAREDLFDTGGHVARARRVADLSQRELADAVGVNQTTVARWEALPKSLHSGASSSLAVDIP